MSLGRVLSFAGLALVASLVLARVHPFGDAGLFGVRAGGGGLREQYSVPPEVRAILTNKCADCHSANTRLPVYDKVASRLAPLSWLMERDIVEGRTHLNLSAWDSYSPERQETLKAKMVQQAKAGAMPLLQYRMIHRNTSVTDAEVGTLARWARGAEPVAMDSAATVEGDAARGAAVFEKRCSGCHSLTQNHEGPRLRGVYGRKSGSVAGFSYSDALVKAQIRWNDDSLERWLADPDAFVPGNNMDFHVAKAQERRDLIRFLRQGAGG